MSQLADCVREDCLSVVPHEHGEHPINAGVRVSIWGPEETPCVGGRRDHFFTRRIRKDPDDPDLWQDALICCRCEGFMYDWKGPSPGPALRRVP